MGREGIDRSDQWGEIEIAKRVTPPEKLLHLLGCDGNVNTKGEWHSVVRDGLGRIFWTWLELPELTALYNRKPALELHQLVQIDGTFRQH